MHMCENHTICGPAGVCSTFRISSSSCSVKFTRVPVKPMEYQPVNVEILPTSGEPGLAPEPAQGHGGRGPSLVLALTRSFGGTFFIAGFFKLGQDLLGFASPQILK